MKTTIFPCFRLFLVLVVLTGVIYPLVVTGLAQILFHAQAQGSLISNGKVIVGSSLLSQKTEDAKYFWPRPSADDYATVASGASNLGPTSDPLKKAIADRVAKMGNAPDDMLTASGSGLDPEISPEAAEYQIDRVAKARGYSPEQMERLKQLVSEHTEGPQFSFLGEPRVNVLMLNLALDQLQ